MNENGRFEGIEKRVALVRTLLANGDTENVVAQFKSLLTLLAESELKLEKKTHEVITLRMTLTSLAERFRETLANFSEYAVNAKTDAFRARGR